MNEVEKIIGIVKQFDTLIIEVDKKIDVALVVEARCEYGAEYPQFCYLVLFAQGDDFVDVTSSLTYRGGGLLVGKG